MSSKFDYKNINKKWKWVLDVPYSHKWQFFKQKPRKVPGGYQDRGGPSYIGKGVRLLSRKQYIKECRERHYEYIKEARRVFSISLWEYSLETIYIKWRSLCDYLLH